MLHSLLTIAAGCLFIGVITLGIPGGLIAAHAYSDEMPSEEIGNDWPIPVQPEPIPQTGPLPYAGWCRFIDPDSFADKLLLHDGILLICSNHSMQAIEADTGELIWENEARDWRSTRSLTIGDGIAAWWDDSLHVLSLEDGTPQWLFATGGAVTSSPVVVENTVYIASGLNLYALDLDTGAGRWRFSTTDVIDSSPAIANGLLYIGSRDGFLYAVGGE